MSIFVIVTMDASPVQSSSKCGGSDFSIERILSNGKDSRDDSEVPDWLCCTRYCPPRIPRANVCRSRRAGRHARVPFTAAQAAALEAAFTRAPYLAPPALKALAAALQLRDDRIKIWFQNRRARERREKSINIAPPQGVTLPPTTANFAATTWISRPTFASQVQGFINTQKFALNLNQGNASENCSDSLSLQKHKVPFTLDARLMPSYKSEDANDRPDTPLDIETVED